MTANIIALSIIAVAIVVLAVVLVLRARKARRDAAAQVHQAHAPATGFDGGAIVKSIAEGRGGDR
jgi:hypothetical protein